jgi:hypothetical protein
MTGRSLHDALLRTLTSAELRRRLTSADATVASLLGGEEWAALRAGNPDRLTRLARFMGRHFYRERIVRLFAASRMLARARGSDPLRVLDGPAFATVLDAAEVGSPATAQQVAGLVEVDLGAVLAALPYASDLIAYEGALFRVEAGPRRWGGTGHGGASGPPSRSPHARLCTVEWDVTGLVAAVRRGDATLPEPARGQTRLLLALGPSGRVTTVRCPDALSRLLAALDGVRSVADAAAVAGVSEADAARTMRQLAGLGAVDWTADAAGR